MKQLIQVSKQQSTAVIVTVTQQPTHLEQPDPLENFRHVGQPMYGTDGTGGHVDLPIFGPLMQNQF